MSSANDPSQENVTFTTGAAVTGVLAGAACGAIAGGIEGVDHFGENTGIVLAVIGAVVGGFTGLRVARARVASANALKDWCRDQGWIWLGSKTPYGRGIARFKPTVKRSKIFWHRARWEDVLVRDGDDIAGIFGVRRIDHDDSPTRYAAFIIVHYPGTCPDTTIEPPNITSRIPKLDGRKRVEFESASFNQHWSVNSKDPKEAYDRLDQATIEFLEKHEIKPAIEFIDELMIIRFDVNRAPRDDHRERLLQWVEEFSHVVPDDLMSPISLLGR